MNSKMKLLINFALFQLGWFACVLGGNQVALIAVPIILIIHFRWVGQWHSEKQLLVITFLLGCTIDSFLGNLDILQFNTTTNEESRLLPLWLAGLWALFATTLQHSLDWARTHRSTGALLGFFGGPLSYLAGSKLTDVALATPVWQSLLVLAIVWTILVPVLQTFSQVLLDKLNNKGCQA